MWSLGHRARWRRAKPDLEGQAETIQHRSGGVWDTPRAAGATVCVFKGLLRPFLELEDYEDRKQKNEWLGWCRKACFPLGLSVEEGARQRARKHHSKQGKGPRGDEPGTSEGQEGGTYGWWNNSRGERREMKRKSYADKCFCKRADVYLPMQITLSSALPWASRMGCPHLQVTENQRGCRAAGPSVPGEQLQPLLPADQKPLQFRSSEVRHGLQLPF